MFSKVALLFLSALISANCRFLIIEDPTGVIEDTMNIEMNDAEDLYFEIPYESVHPGRSRIRRQVHGGSQLNPDGTMSYNLKAPIVGNDKNILSGVGNLDYNKNIDKIGSVGGGLALDNVNGHGASLTGRHIPDFGNQLTGAGHLNLLQNENHRVGANAFATRTMPSIPNVPNFNTYGGGVDYTFKDKIGASLGAAHTPLFQKTDYSAMGNLNLFRNSGSSLDFNAGLSKSVSPFIPKQSWQPSGNLIFRKTF